MKTMKRILLLMTCTFVLLGTAACSSRDNADNGADQSTDNRNDQNNTDDTNGTDNVNGTDNANDSNVNGATNRIYTILADPKPCLQQKSDLLVFTSGSPFAYAY